MVGFVCFVSLLALSLYKEQMFSFSYFLLKTPPLGMSDIIKRPSVMGGWAGEPSTFQLILHSKLQEPKLPGYLAHRVILMHLSPAGLTAKKSPSPTLAEQFSPVLDVPRLCTARERGGVI